MFGRPRKPIHDWLRAKFKSKPDIADANIAALDAGCGCGRFTAMQHEVCDTAGADSNKRLIQPA